MSRAHRARRDRAEPEVIETLEACGWKVTKLAQKGIPDLLASKGGEIRLIEVKTGSAKLRDTQLWWDEMDMPVYVLRSRDQVLAWHQEQTGDRT